MKKERILIIVCVLLSVIAIALGGYIIYDKINSPKTKSKTDIVSLAKNNGVVITEEDYTFYAYLDKGTLYYQVNDGSRKKYTEVSNIKKIKSFPYGTSMRTEFFLITESGKVYSTIDYFEDDLNFTETKIFKNYEVSDILSKKGEVKEEFEVLLKDGNIVTLTRSLDNEDNADIQEDNTIIQQDLIQNGNEIEIHDGIYELTAYLDKGNLYYQVNDSSRKKYSEVTNIKRIKIFSYGTSMRFELFLITESGKVYSTIEFFADELTFTETEIFKNYEVDDIISKTGEVKEEFEVSLKNGKKIMISRSLDN